MLCIDQLRREHALIRTVLQHATQALAPFDRAVLQECLAFFVDFVEGAHVQKEEQVMFVALQSWAPDVARGPLEVMQREHHLARAYLRSAVHAIRAGPSHKPRLLGSVERYAEAMHSHLRKEEEVLFELAQIALPPSRDAELAVSMQDMRREVMSDAQYAHWVQVASNERSSGTMVIRDRPRRPGEVIDARTLTEDPEEPDSDDTGHSMRAGGVLFEQDGHRNVWLHDFGRGLAVQANQFLIVDDGCGMILDPGGPKVYPDVLAETMLHLGTGKLEHIFLSHQDPDIGTSLNAWLMDTEADAMVSKLWVRFLPHFGIDKLLSDRLRAIPDEGQWMTLGRRDLLILPAHFLHSCGNFQVYDPTSKILFSGDLGAAVGSDEAVVSDFEAHRTSMEAFHRRYMGSTKALQAWVRMVRELDVETIAPQHGGLYQGPQMVGQFLDWASTFECGIDTLEGLFTVPRRP